MNATRLLAPLSLVVIALAVALTLLGTPDTPTSRAQQAATAEPTAVPANYPPPQNSTDTAYPAPQTDATPTETEVSTAAPRTPPAVPPTSVATAVEPPTPIATPVVATPFIAPTRAPPSQSQPAAAPTVAADDVATATLTPTETSDLVCPPGEPIAISAEGPPAAGYLILFGGRTVGGGTVPPDGHLHAELIVGRERPGRYLVSIIQRGTGQELRRLSCTVPPRQPQPTPRP